jgi:hypothetical protein
MQCVKTPDAKTRLTLRTAAAFACVFFLLVIGSFANIAHAATTKIIHPGPESALDKRNEYDWIVLRAALEKTRRAKGDFVLSENNEFINLARGLYEMSLPDGRINVLAKVSTIELEKKLLPIRIPFDLGIRGYRI